jgi:4-hydroxy 2-oxovalerate aldolase
MKQAHESTTPEGWVTFRPEIKVLDCTVRDGGLVNEHQFTDEFVKGVYSACVAAGVDYMELGYKGAKRLYSPTVHGKWKHCTEDDMRAIVGENETSLKLCAMADAERCDYRTDILPRKDSVLDLIRVACYIHQLPLAIDMIKDAADKGYETTLNIMALSTVQEAEIRTALGEVVKSPVNVLYIVDSYGSLYTEQVDGYTKLFLEYTAGTGKLVGMHAHNNQQLAYANTIQSIIAGADWLDATINGLGRGAGNCQMELLLGFLKNPKFKLRPILEAIRDRFVPLSKEIEWGYNLQYMVSGLLNQHPREAIEWLEGPKRDDFVAFYDYMME